MSKQISDGRKLAYYLGGGLMLLGIILCFGAILIGGPLSMGSRGFPTIVFVPFGLGMVLAIIGGVLKVSCEWSCRLRRASRSRKSTRRHRAVFAHGGRNDQRRH